MITVAQELPGTSARRTARCEYRTTPEIKQAIAQAAARVGMDESAFALSAILAAVREVERAEQQTLIAPEHREAFLAALDAPATVLPGLAAMAEEDR